MSNEPTHFDLNKIERVPVDVATVEKYTSNGQFMGLSVELLKEVAALTTILACTYHLDDLKRPRNWNRNEAILSGLLVRTAKLYHGYLDQVCQHRGEIAGILFRPLMETLINLKFLLAQEDDAMFDEFIEYSLREEKRLHQKIERNIKARGGEELPIEKRMKASIERAFKKSGFTHEQVNEESRASWGGSIFKRAKAVGMEDAYSSLMGLPSHSVHGNWQDLITNHLEYEKDGTFTPNTDWSDSRPQAPFALALVSVAIGKEYLEKMIPEYHEKKQLKERLDDLMVRIAVADDLHEKFLQDRQAKN